MTLEISKITNKSNQNVSWAHSVHDNKVIAAGLAAAVSYNQDLNLNKRWQGASKFIDSEIESARIITNYLVKQDMFKKASNNTPIPVVLVPRGGVLSQKGVIDSLTQNNINAKSYLCPNVSKKFQLSPEILAAANQCGKLIITDDVIKEGRRMFDILNGLYENGFKGEVILITNRVYKNEVLTKSALLNMINGVLDRPDKKIKRNITLYTASVVVDNRLQDPIDVGQLLAEFFDSTHTPESIKLQYQWIKQALRQTQI